jgi:hypothetical protein
VRPPPSDPHVLHTPLELCKLCVTHFESAWLTCAMHVSRGGLKLSLFGHPRSDHQSVLFMMRHEVQTKFRQHNPDVLHYTIFKRADGEQWGYAAEMSFGPCGSS